MNYQDGNPDWLGGKIEQQTSLNKVKFTIHLNLLRGASVDYLAREFEQKNHRQTDFVEKFSGDKESSNPFDRC